MRSSFMILILMWEVIAIAIDNWRRGGWRDAFSEVHWEKRARGKRTHLLVLVDTVVWRGAVEHTDTETCQRYPRHPHPHTQIKTGFCTPYALYVTAATSSSSSRKRVREVRSVWCHSLGAFV